MNKRSLLWSAVVLAVLVAIPVFAEGANFSFSIGGGSGGFAIAMETNGGRYRNFSKTDFAKSDEDYRVHFFHANWCSFCKTADKEISAQKDRIPDNVVVFKTNYDSEKALKKQYGVFSQHTFVLVDRDGNEIAQWSGGGIDTLIDKIEEHTR